MSNDKIKEIFQSVRLGVSLDDIDDSTLREYLNVTNEHGRNLLHEAIANKRETYALFLIKLGINVNYKDEKGATPLHYAGVYKLPLVAESILAHGGNPNLVDEHGNGPLWTAVFNARGDYRIVEILKKFDVQITLKNKYGKSPLDFALQINDEPLISILTK